jgi:prepilin-type N-terminal cleavage/methylation domain-containing protein
MNRSQMKSAIAKFKSADVSIIKDDALRAKAQKLQAKQKGFTLLELLVVITLLATIATAGLVAYEGIGDNAQATATASHTIAAESSIRSYRAIEGEYPNQWDNLANRDGTLPGTTGVEPLLDDTTEAFFGQLVTTPASPLAGGTVLEAVAESLESVGIDELQTLQETVTTPNGAIPNLAWNESSPKTAGQASELEFSFNPTTGALADIEWDETSQLGSPVALSIVPSGGNGGCTVDGATISDTFDGTTVANSAALNLINDALGDDDCHLVLALGFGKDVPGTTIDSRVAISQAPTAVSDNVSPATDYARYIALFHLASEEGPAVVGVTPIPAANVLSRPRLIGVVNAEGQILDQAIAAANQNN